MSDTLPFRPPVQRVAKIFTNGGSQAVRIPKEFALPGTEVWISREDGRVVLTPVPEPTCQTVGELMDYLAAVGNGPSTIERPAQGELPPTVSWDEHADG